MNEVLILSSDPVFNHNIVKALTKAGFKGMTASDLLEGILKIDKESFDVIVIDEELPDADNYLACRRIRHSSDIPIILLGSEAEENVWDRVEELGFDFYLKKPVSVTELIARIKAALRWAPSKGKTVEVSVTTTAPSQEPEVPFLKAAESEVTPSQLTVASASVPRETPVKVWQNVKIAKLIDCLLTGKLAEISPEIDLSLKDGFTYPQADKILGTSGGETAHILESLTEEGILHKRPFVKLLLSPEGSVEMVPVESCPYCDSSDIVKGQLIEHLACGCVGLEVDFKVGLEYICSKCQKEIRLIGTDCRNFGTRYRCHSCHEIFPAPVTKFRYLETGESYTRDELREVWVNAYCFNEAKKDWLEFELETRAQLIDFLQRRGYQAKEAVKVTGKSGTVFTWDILAIKDDVVGKHIIGIGIFVAKPGETEVAIEELFDFEAKACDTGIQDKVVIAISELAAEAQKFAERRGIKVFKAKDLRILSFGQPKPFPKAENGDKACLAGGS